MIEAVLYPSKTVSDLWAAVELETADDQKLVGVIAREDSDSVTIRTAAGFPVRVPKTEIRSRTVSATSLMPEGLLNNLELRETIDLFAFLEKGQ